LATAASSSAAPATPQTPPSEQAQDASAKLTATIAKKDVTIVDAKGGHVSKDGTLTVFLSDKPIECPDLRPAGARELVLNLPWKAGVSDGAALSHRQNGKFTYSAANEIDGRGRAKEVVDKGIPDLSGKVEVLRADDNGGRLKLDLTWGTGSMKGEVDVTTCR
jgi:hypothetical protein